MNKEGKTRKRNRSFEYKLKKHFRQEQIIDKELNKINKSSCLESDPCCSNINRETTSIHNEQITLETQCENPTLGNFVNSSDDDDFEFSCRPNDTISSNEIVAPQDDSPQQFNLKEFSSKLCEWCNGLNISQVAINSLLAILREVPELNNLPKDSRCLLKTPRRIDDHVLGHGSYSYIGIKNGIEDALKSKDKIPSNLKLLLNIDGLPISKSSGGQLWPQLGKIRNLPSSKVFPIGIYYGKEKPQDPNKYMAQLIDELNCLIEKGINVGDNTYNIEHVGFVCDAPAKAFLLQTKGHNGYFSCTRCLQEGDYIDRRFCLPDIEFTKRTHESFCKKDQEEHHIGDTNLTKIKSIDMISSFSLDYMHLVCLGVTKKLLKMWVSGKLKNRLQSKTVREISTSLTLLRPYIPSDFVRKPRGLDELCRWKATELRQFLLYTGMVVLAGHLKDEIYINFLTLQVAMILLLNEDKCIEFRDYANQLLRHFVSTFSKIYGPQYVSHNVHCLLHISDDVTTYGSLDTCSAFDFESYLQVLKKMLRKNDKPLQQIVRRLHERSLVISESKPKTVPTKELIVKKTHRNGPMTLTTKGPQYMELILRSFKISTALKDRCCGLMNGKIIIVKNIAHSRDTNIHVVIGSEMKKVGDLFKLPLNSSILGIHIVKEVSTIKVWPAKQIIMKYMCLPHKQEKSTFVVVPIIHTTQ